MMIPKATEEIKLKVENGDYKLRDKVNIKSDVWERFKEIIDKNEKVIKDVVACKFCCKVIVFHSHKTGTSSLRKHKCGCLELTAAFKSQNSLQTNQKGLEKKADKQTILNDICQSLTTFNSMVNNGLLDGAQPLIENNSRRYWSDIVYPQGIKSKKAEEPDKLEDDERSISPLGIMPVVCKIESIADDDLLEAIGNQVDHLSHMRNHNTFSTGSPSHASSSSRFLEETDEPFSSPNKRSNTSNADREGGPTSETISQIIPKSYNETNRSYEDEHDVFGRHVANELRSLPDNVARRWARFNIQKTLFEAHSFGKKEAD